MKTLNSGAGQIVLILALILFCANAFGETFVPPDADLGDLDHGNYYIWAIDFTFDPLVEEIKGAALYFDHMANWDDSPNDLWVHLLDNWTQDYFVGTDGGDGVDEFAKPVYDPEILLVHYVNLSSTPEDRIYVLDGPQLDTLNNYAADGRFVLAFDPDCHFNNCGVEFEVGVDAIPEPGTMALAGIGIVLLLTSRRAKKR